MAQRSDILSEADTTLDGGGNYTGPWIDVAEISSVVATWTEGLSMSSGYPRLQLSADGSNVIRAIEPVAAHTEVLVPARFIRFQVSTSGGSGQTFRLSIKAAS